MAASREVNEHVLEGSWLVKIKRYDGSESILKLGQTEESAKAYAALHNMYVQSDIYRAEAWDKEKWQGWTL